MRVGVRDQNHKRTVSKTKRLRSAFTIIEVMAGVTIIGLVAGSVIYTLNQLNYYATVNRLYTAAQTMAQNQVDLILTKGPYNPAASPVQMPNPNILQIGTYYTKSDGTITNTSTPIAIYTDPSNQVVMGTLKTDVSDPGISLNGSNLPLRQATVTVTYTYRGKQFSIKMNTIRASDV